MNNTWKHLTIFFNTSSLLPSRMKRLDLRSPTTKSTNRRENFSHIGLFTPFFSSFSFHLFAFSRDEENFNFTLQFFFEADDSRAIVGGGGGDERAEGQPEEESMGTFVDQAMGGGVM